MKTFLFVGFVLEVRRIQSMLELFETDSIFMGEATYGIGGAPAPPGGPKS